MKKSEREKLQQAKAAAKKAAEEKAAKKRTLGKVGEHGMRENTIKFALFQSIKKKSKTHSELIKEDWNKNGKPQYGYLNEMVKSGLIKIEKGAKRGEDKYCINASAPSTKKKAAKAKKAKK